MKWRRTRCERIGHLALLPERSQLQLRDDTYDYPYGYGVYAEYGPCAYGRNVTGGCFLTQKMRADGLRSALANGQGVQLKKSWIG